MENPSSKVTSVRKTADSNGHEGEIPHGDALDDSDFAAEGSETDEDLHLHVDTDITSDNDTGEPYNTEEEALSEDTFTCNMTGNAIDEDIDNVGDVDFEDALSDIMDPLSDIMDPTGDEQGSEDEQDSDEQDSEDGDDTLNDAIFNGSQISKAEAMLMILSFVMRHCLSSAAAAHLLELINILCSREIFNSIQSIMKNIFSGKAISLSFHFYCVTCYSYVKSFESLTEDIVLCPHCNDTCVVKNLSNGNFFVTADLSSQVRALFERSDIVPHLSYRQNRQKISDEGIEDVFDGEFYQKLLDDGELLGNNNNFSYMFNSDGLPVFKSSKYSMWPIFLMINELPLKLRHQNLILAGVWFGKVEPKMEVFLEKFTECAKKLAEEGMTWKKGEEEIHSKLFGICCCADAPARASMQNTVRFNGYNGCSLCYHPGKIVERVVKYPIDVCEYSDRTDEEVMADMAQSFEESRSIRGVKGPSPLINLPHFPICWGFPPDFMHCLLLGVARQLADLWFSSAATNPFYIGSTRVMAVISSRLKSIRPPSTVARTPRPITERKYWKASEWYMWLLVYCLPCLNGILPQEYWTHLLILVEASYLLLQKSISNADLHMSDLLLFSFVGRCQILYGATSMTFNIHSLTHLSKSVRKWGPLWTHSCFPFEAGNWRIKRQLQGNSGMIMQAMRKFLFVHMLPSLLTKHVVSHEIKLFCNMMSCSRKKNTVYDFYRQDVVLGMGTVRLLKDWEYAALIASGYRVAENRIVTVYKRLKRNGLLFCTAEYRSNTIKRNNRLIVFSDKRIGELLSIVTLDDQCFMIVKWLILEELESFCDVESDAKISHIKLCTGTNNVLAAVLATEAEVNSVEIIINDARYIITLPNYVALN